MVEYLESPIPYIVGVPRELWKYVYENKWDILGEEVVAFDIDNQRVYEKEPLPEFPQPYTQLLIKQLEIQLDKNAMRDEEKFWNNFTLKVKQQFLNFLIFLINTFENFYITASDSPSKLLTLGAQGTAASTIDSNNLPNTNINSNCANFPQGSANDIFNFDEYVQNVRENQSFFRQFVRTQAFINFIEQAFYEEQGNLSDASIRFFKECTRKLSKENIQTVRAMQDAMIQGLMHKFNNRGISYSIDKCHLIYEQSLRTQQKIKQHSALQQQTKFGLINKLDHQKIITMSHFDPQYLIEKQYTKGNESMYSVQNLDNQRSNKKPPHYYKDIMKDLNIEEPPYHDNKKTGLPLADYFTVQGTPNGHYKMMLEFNDQEIQLEQLNKTSQLIMIEDNMDEASNTSHMVKDDQRIEERSNENSSTDQGHENDPTFLGFFKKTFSSVKKTFESTFNQNQLKAKSQTRPPTSNHHSLRRQGANTPAIENPSRLEYDKASSNHNRVTQTKVTTRTIRSQTFHEQSNNQVQNKQEEPARRDRKNNNSFFANLLNLGSNNKNDRNASNDNSFSPNKEEIKNQTLAIRARKRILNGSGFFVFNEEDMKSMTEMSPKQVLKQKGTVAINVAKSQSFQFDNPLMENQNISRQIPLIKVSTPSLDKFQSQNLAMRMRSISYQNQSKLSNVVNGGMKPSIKLMNLLNESLNQSQIIEETPQSYSTKEQNVKSNRITFAANTETLMSPIPKYSEHREANITASEHTHKNSQIVFNMNEYQAKGVRSFRQTPIQSNNMSAFKESEAKQASEFEELYKKSTENLFFVPPARNLENGYKEKFNIWKSQSGKVNLSGISGTHTAPPKPPKHQNNQNSIKNQLAHQIKIQTSQNIKKQQISPKFVKLPSNNFEEKHKLHKSLNSDIYNEKNSTDEESKAPIMGKNLGQFNNIMRIPFDKQTQIKNSSQSNKSHKPHSVMKSHKRQLSSGLQNLKIKGETSVTLNSPLLENIEPDDSDFKQNSKQAMQIESMQIGRARKKSTVKNSSVLNKSGSNIKKGIQQNYSKQQTTLNHRSQNLRPSQVLTQSKQQKFNNLKKPPQHSHAINTKIFVQGSTIIKDEIIEFAENNLNKPAIYKNIQVKTNQSQNQSYNNSQQHQYSSCPSKSSLSSSQNESIAAVNSSKIEVQKHIRRLDEKSMIQQLHEDMSQSIDQSNLNYFSNCSQSEVQNTQSYINAVNNSQIDLRESKKGDFLRLKSQAVVNSPVNSSQNKYNLAKYTPQTNHNSQHPQMRMHSLSQYTNQQQDTQSMGNPRSQVFNRVNNDQQSNILSRDLKIQTSGSKNYIEQDSGDNTISLKGGPQFNHGPRNNIKPLNKITWDAFSQIAKLSGDVDHEPHTPKSAGIGSDEDID